ncbi:hypothetical protein HZB02_00165 [Candidatus Woesearchaeota archaeon]|nr:hypothetical protein [Candidatus Woesearchaeota archaeon]
MIPAKKGLVFDTGPIISLTLNNLLWLIEPLRQQFGGTFYITPRVKEELVDQPLRTRKYKFEAIQVMPYISRNILTFVYNDTIKQRAGTLMGFANTVYWAQGNPLQIIQLGEMEALAAAVEQGALGMVVDERSTRMLLEDPAGLRKIIESHLHMRVTMNQEALEQFHAAAGHLSVIRSAELVAMAFELGLLDKYMDPPSLRMPVLEGALWAIKLSGCAISEQEILDILKLETKSG